MEKFENHPLYILAKITLILLSVITGTFIILKLSSVVIWNWWWIFSPLWIFAGLSVIVFLILFVIIMSDIKHT